MFGTINQLGSHLPLRARRIVRRLSRRPAVDSEAALVNYIRQSGVFDAQWYLKRYPKVARSGIDPVLHYVKYGASEGRSANEWFSSGFYLKSYPDVAEAGVNPLYHYCTMGYRELRNPSAAFDTSWYWLSYLALSDCDANPLAHYMSSGRAAGCEIRAVDTMTPADRQTLARVCEQFWRRKGQSVSLLSRLATACARLSLKDDEEQALRSAAACAPTNSAAHDRLARVLARHGKWWQAIEPRKRAIALDSNRADWFFELGEVQEKLNRFDEAAESYLRAVELNAEPAFWHYCLGYACEKAGQSKKARDAYAEALRRDEREDVQRFGVGMMHQKRGRWPEAAAAYACRLENEPLDAELHFRHAMAEGRCYRWKEAEQAYRDAIARKPDVPYWHYRYGFVLERQNRFMEAAQAYEAAAVLDSKARAYWRYRCGYTLERAGQYEHACVAYIQTRATPALAGGGRRAEATLETSAGGHVHANDATVSDTTNPIYGEAAARSAEDLARARLGVYLSGFVDEEIVRHAIARDTTDAQAHYWLGEVLERKQDWTGAAIAYADALARSGERQSAWYYRRGFVLFRAGRFEDACAAFRDIYRFKRPHGVDTSVYARSNAEAFQDMVYREHLNTLPVQPRTVVYESTQGANVGGNPYAIFRYLIGRPDDADWLHVWVVTPTTAVPADLQRLSNVVLVERGSYLYRRYLATAGYLISDATFPYWFTRRAQQKYLNTWHGTPLKALGKALQADDEFLTYHNVQHNLLHATHVISPNPHTSTVLMRDFDVAGIFAGKLAETGYPRIDRTLGAPAEQKAEIRARLGLHGDLPVVLYAPTWRGVFGQPEVDGSRLRRDLARLAKLPCQLVFRGHPFAEGLLDETDLPVTLAPSAVDTADVLAVTDILVTDYSSIFFDFLPTRRPIFHYCYDLDEYTSQRGMYFDMDEMPGVVCRDMDALFGGVRETLDGVSVDQKRYVDALQKFCPHADGMATSRVIEFFLHDDDRDVVTRYADARPSVLIFGGHFAANGICRAFLNLTSALQERGAYHITAAIEPNRVKAQRARRDNFRQLASGITIWGRVGRMVCDPEQAWVAAKFRVARTFPSDAMKEVFQAAYRDEFRRCFGDAKFDAVVDFDGYNPYWTTLFSATGDRVTNACWFHSDYASELSMRYPYLRSQMTSFPAFDHLVSVSETAAAKNREYLQEQLAIAPAAFMTCTNVLGFDAIVEKSREALDDAISTWLDGAFVFGTLGRLSPEKGHARLISAFAAFAEQAKAGDNVRLVIAGDGPLREALQTQIDGLGLASRVRLMGHMDNPYPLIKRLDAFVFSSYYEGQGLAILEARALGKPVVSTDVVGVRSLLDHGRGLLVADNEQALAAGLAAAYAGEVPTEPFDGVAYDREAVAAFGDVIARRSVRAPATLSHAG